MYRVSYAQIFGLILLLAFSAGSCSNKARYSDDQRDELVKLIMDLHVAEASMAKVPDKFKDSLRLANRSEIARIHHLEEWELDSLVLRIQEDPKFYKALTIEAMSRLDSLERALH